MVTLALVDFASTAASVWFDTKADEQCLVYLGHGHPKAEASSSQSPMYRSVLARGELAAMEQLEPFACITH